MEVGIMTFCEVFEALLHAKKMEWGILYLAVSGQINVKHQEYLLLTLH